MTEIMHGQDTSPDHSLSASPGKDGSPATNEALEQLKQISVQGSAARLLANPGAIDFSKASDIYGSPSDSGGQTGATLEAQALWVAPPIFKDGGNKEVHTVHGDQKASPFIEQKTPNGHTSTENSAPAPLPTGHEKPVTVPQKSEAKPTVSADTVENLNSIEKLATQHANQSHHMNDQLDQASHDLQNDHSFLHYVNLSNTEVKPTAEGGKATIGGGVWGERTVGEGATYEDPKGDKLEVGTCLNDAYTTNFKDGYTDYGKDSPGTISLEPGQSTIVLESHDTVVDNFGNVFQARSDNSQAIRTTDGNIYVRSAGEHGWHESFDARDKIASPDQLKAVHDQYEKEHSVFR